MESNIPPIYVVKVAKNAHTRVHPKTLTDTYCDQICFPQTDSVCKLHSLYKLAVPLRGKNKLDSDNFLNASDYYIPLFKHSIRLK